MKKTRKVILEPVSRVEGHGKVTVHLDENGKVSDAFFHIVEFRGFERFIQGHPYWEVPVMVQRLCGICPVSHHLAAAKAIDQIVGIDPNALTPTASLLRRLLHYAQIFQSHALHFFYLASPDLLLGIDANPEIRNIVGVAKTHKELAKKGIQMRKFGQELIEALAGKRIHGIVSVPGGVHKTFTPEERAYFLDGKACPNVDTMIEWTREMINFMKNYHEQHRSWLDNFAVYPSGHLSLVDTQGALELYDGRLKAIDATGNTTLDIEDRDYIDYFYEGVEKWTYLKFPYLKHIGRENGWNRVGPLARINIASHLTTPQAEQERFIFKAQTDHKPNHMTMHTHWARLIEMLHCAELIRDLLHNDAVMGTDLRTEGTRRNEGMGVIEAPRGTLIHHYLVDDEGKVERCNLIVSTTHNNEAMNRAVRWVVQHEWKAGTPITEPMLNQIEVAIRAYDPCLSCATHALGKMPLKVSIYDAQNQKIDEQIKS